MRSTIRILTAALLAACLVSVALAQGVRPEVGKPLQQASDLLKAGKAKEALARATRPTPSAARRRPSS